MNRNFISFEKQIFELLQAIVKDSYQHGLWLNTLSYLENCGARKIAASEHPTAVKEEKLKHAAEEFRHAFYLKRQLLRIDQHFEDYRIEFLLGSVAGYHYLDALDIHVSRYLKKLGMSNLKIKEHAYLLVTYAIELRAAELYPIYQAILKEHQSKIQVSSILLEEKEHLQEMEENLSSVDGALVYVEVVCKIESVLFEKWLSACHKEVLDPYNQNTY